MANIQRLKELSQFLKNLDKVNFRWMSVNAPKRSEPITCTTKACIAGWSHYLFGNEDDIYWDDAMPELGITIDEARFLCYAQAWKDFPSLPNFGPIEEAIARVDALIEHYESLTNA